MVNIREFIVNYCVLEEMISTEAKKEPMEVDSLEDYSEVMNDPAFLQSVLENLPGMKGLKF